MTDESPPFVRTDFSDSLKWEELLREASKENEMGMRAYFSSISDLRFNGANPKELSRAFPDAVVVFVVDAHASLHREILCIDGEDSSSSFRVKPEDLWMVENNLSVGNLLFEELMEQVGDEGVLMALEM